MTKVPADGGQPSSSPPGTPAVAGRPLSAPPWPPSRLQSAQIGAADPRLVRNPAPASNEPAGQRPIHPRGAPSVSQVGPPGTPLMITSQHHATHRDPTLKRSWNGRENAPATTPSNLGARVSNMSFSAPAGGISAGPTTARGSSGPLLMAGTCPGTGKPGQPFPFS